MALGGVGNLGLLGCLFHWIKDQCMWECEPCSCVCLRVISVGSGHCMETLILTGEGMFPCSS
jgi:hypothetical protein